MSFTRNAAFALACLSSLATVDAREDKPKAEEEAAIKTFVAYLAENGVKIEADERNWWRVTDPKSDGYKVIVALKTFPATTSVKEMLANLKTINLAYMLNAKSHLAMSHPGLQGADPKDAPKLDQIPVVAKLKKLFEEYRPEAKK